MPAPIARPSAALVAPTIIDHAFVDPELVLDLLDRGAPYKTLAAVHKDPPGTPATPWFRNFWALGGKVIFPGTAEVFHNPRFIEAAKDIFNADVISPLAMMTNLNAPSPAGPMHLDLPFFRGAHQREVPAWMLAPMGYSGLFGRWAIPVATTLTWFYRGQGGEFEFWQDGPDQPSRLFADLGNNHALVADNEYTYHRVCEVGSSDDFLDANEVPYDAELHLDNDEWVIRDRRVELARYRRDEMRLSVLWKAFCFRDQAEADAFTSGADNLTPALVVEQFQDDLRRRGITVEPPENLEGTDRWSNIIRETYTGAET